MAIILFLNLKGGVAKTTNAVATAECLACEGYRTLLIDADHQCMAGELALGEDLLMRCEQRRTTLHDLLAAMLEVEFHPGQVGRFVVSRVSNIQGGLDTLDCLPCSIRIDDFSTNMAKARRGHRSNDEFLQTWRSRRKQLRVWLSRNYEYTVVDCPPSISLQVRLLLGVADYFIVPSIPDRLSVRGSLYLLDRIEKTGFKIQGLGTLWSLHREQNPLHRRVVDMGVRGLPPVHRLPRPFDTVIPNASGIAEAAEAGAKPGTFGLKYGHKFAHLFQSLCQEIRQRDERLAFFHRAA